MKRKHGTLTGSTDKHQEESGRNHECSFGKAFGTELKSERLAVVSVDKNTYQEAKVGKTGYDERFLAGSYRFGLSIIEADEEVRRYTYQLPEYIHLEDVSGNYQSQHRERKERKEGVVTLKTFLAFHVAERIDVHHKADGRYNYQHHDGNRVEQDTHIYMKSVCKRQPLYIPRCQGRINPVGCTRRHEVFKCSKVAQYGYSQQRGGTDKPCYTVLHKHACQS